MSIEVDLAFGAGAADEDRSSGSLPFGKCTGRYDRSDLYWAKSWVSAENIENGARGDGSDPASANAHRFLYQRGHSGVLPRGIDIR